MTRDGRTWNDCLCSLSETLPKDWDAALQAASESRLAALELNGGPRGERLRCVLNPTGPKETALAVLTLAERLHQEGVFFRLTPPNYSGDGSDWASLLLPPGYQPGLTQGGRSDGCVCVVRLPDEGWTMRVREVRGESYSYPALVGLGRGFWMLSRRGEPHPYRQPPGWSRKSQYAHMFRPGDPGDYPRGPGRLGAGSSGTWAVASLASKWL